MKIKRGEIYLADLGNSIGAEQSGTRPVVIAQNQMGNAFSPTTIVCPLTSRQKKSMSTHVELEPGCGVVRPSVVLCEQLRVIDKNRLIKKLGSINDTEKIREIDLSISVSLGLL